VGVIHVKRKKKTSVVAVADINRSGCEFGRGRVEQPSVNPSRNGELLRAFATLRKATISLLMGVLPSVYPSLRPHGTTRLQMDGFQLTN
jgi:hypothetical protein